MVKANEQGMIDRGDGIFVPLGRPTPIEDDIEEVYTFNSGETWPILYYPDPHAGASDGVNDGNYKAEAKYNSWVVEDGFMVEQDVEIRLHDGTLLYADIFRPVTNENIR